MKFIKLESFWKEPSAWLVNVDDIIFVEDKTDYRDVTIRVNENDNEHKIIRVKNTLDNIHAAIEVSKNVEMTLPGCSCKNHLNS